MIISNLFPLAVAVIGALLYGLTSGKLSELGRLAFFAGLLALVLNAANSCKTLHI
jgi:hypothetical protein